MVDAFRSTLSNEDDKELVPKQTPEAAGTKPTVAEMRADLARRITAHAPSAGETATAVPGLTLFRKTAPSACYLASVEPSFTVFVQGKKRINISSVEYLCDETSFLVASIDVPIQSQIIEASQAVPQLSIRRQLRGCSRLRHVLSMCSIFQRTSRFSST
jgi:AraC-type transcriptional regulator N-terminus